MRQHWQLGRILLVAFASRLLHQHLAMKVRPSGLVLPVPRLVQEPVLPNHQVYYQVELRDVESLSELVACLLDQSFFRRLSLEGRKDIEQGGLQMAVSS